MKIGDRVFVHGYIDEIRKDIVIIRNNGGYFGTVPSEVVTGDLPSAHPYTTEEIQKMAELEQAEIEKAFELGREDALNEIIRCKDCKHKYVDGDNVRYNVCELNHNKVQRDEWYCADAERLEE